MTVDLGTPNPKQEQFLLSEKRRVCYGGARGGGKSWVVALLVLAALLVTIFGAQATITLIHGI